MAQQEVRQKLMEVSLKIDEAISQADRRDLKIFRSALVVAKAKQIRWVKFPSPSQFDK
jgi:hypothetical protein